MMDNKLIDQIDALLPQTQCGLCDYPGCRPYAKAMAENNETIDKCAPGGLQTLHQLANLLGKDAKPFEQKVIANTRPPAKVVIREDLCIGCTKCIAACPVDAIVGAAKQMHTIIESECTGCELCIEPCPMDCIDLVPLAQENYDRDKARTRHQFQQQRTQQNLAQKAKRHEQAKLAKQAPDETSDPSERRKQYIADALSRVKNKKSQDFDEQ